MSFNKSFLINDSELAYVNNGAINGTAVFKDHDGKKYLKDPFNNLIKDDLLYHHNIRVYRDCNFSTFKKTEAETNVRDRVLLKKGVLKEIIICARPCTDTVEVDFSSFAEKNFSHIKFNLKVFCLNYASDLIIERKALNANMILDVNISFKNTLNNTALFEVDAVTIFQNTNLCFIVVKNTKDGGADMKALYIYDLLTEEVLETVTNFQKVLFLDNAQKRFGIVDKENQLIIYKIKNHNIHGFYLKKVNTVNIDFKIPQNKGLFHSNKTFLCISDKTEGQIINFELNNLLTVTNDGENKEDNKRIQMELFTAHKTSVYNVAISPSTKFVLTTSTSGTKLKLFVKQINENKRLKCPLYLSYCIFKRGIEKALNYEMGFSNDEKIAYCLSFKRTLHFFLIPEKEADNGSGGGGKNVHNSIQSLRLTSRITDDTCKITMLKTDEPSKNTISYNVYVLWKLSGIIELHSLTVGKQTVECRKLNWLLLY
ncbi:hypothetical protein QEN19_002571 [Hanseniaspora menglaensis]